MTDRPDPLPGQDPANAANRGQEPAGERWPAPSPDARRDLPGPENDAREAGEPDRGDLQRQAEQHDRDARPDRTTWVRVQTATRIGTRHTGAARTGPVTHGRHRLSRHRRTGIPGTTTPGSTARRAAPRRPIANSRWTAASNSSAIRLRSATKKAADLAQRASTKADAVIAMADPTTGASPRQSRAPGQGKGLEHLKRMMHGGQKRAGLAATPPTKTPEARAHKGQTAGAFIKQLREGRGGGRQQQEQDGGRERTNL